MRYVQLGRTGLKVSEACLGTNMFGNVADEAASRAMVDAAIDAGINFIDTADMYASGRSEEYLGKAIQGRRGSLVIATKVRGAMGPGPNDEGLSRRHIMDGAEASLHRLGIDTIDLYQMHWPDAHTPLEETLRALDDLIAQGKVRYIGVSNFEAWRIMQALWISDRHGHEPFVCLQPHYSLINREIEAETLPMCHEQGIAVIPYSPTAGGFLTGKYKRGEPLPEGTRGARNPQFAKRFTEANWAALDRLQAMAQAKGCGPHHLALAWVAAHPAVTAPIVGCSNADQLRDNLKYLDYRLTPAERKQLSGE
ncbi:MAG: aldo/keto reductase [Chloroflexi bacterium]|nr:aldo/keto reductase [Chloroflexota bacterium]